MSLVLSMARLLGLHAPQEDSPYHFLCPLRQGLNIEALSDHDAASDARSAPAALSEIFPSDQPRETSADEVGRPRQRGSDQTGFAGQLFIP